MRASAILRMIASRSACSSRVAPRQAADGLGTPSAEAVVSRQEVAMHPAERFFMVLTWVSLVGLVISIGFIMLI
jgi:hypothetical protein